MSRNEPVCNRYEPVLRFAQMIKKNNEHGACPVAGTQYRAGKNFFTQRPQLFHYGLYIPFKGGERNAITLSQCYIGFVVVF